MSGPRQKAAAGDAAPVAGAVGAAGLAAHHVGRPGAVMLGPTPAQPAPGLRANRVDPTGGPVAVKPPSLPTKDAA